MFHVLLVSMGFGEAIFPTQANTCEMTRVFTHAVVGALTVFSCFLGMVAGNLKDGANLSV